MLLAQALLIINVQTLDSASSAVPLSFSRLIKSSIIHQYMRCKNENRNDKAGQLSVGGEVFRVVISGKEWEVRMRTLTKPFKPADPKLMQQLSHSSEQPNKALCKCA